jgi:hypothetical protein
MSEIPELNPCFNPHADSTARERYLLIPTTVIILIQEVILPVAPKQITVILVSSVPAIH